MLESRRPIKPLIGPGITYPTTIDKKLFRLKRIETSNLVKREETEPKEVYHTLKACKHSKNIKIFRIGWFMPCDVDNPKLNLLGERIKGFRSLQFIDMYIYR